MKPLDLTTLPDLECELPKHFSFATATTMNSLEMLPISKDFNYAYTYKIVRFCHTEGLTFEDVWTWYKKKDDSYEK